MDFTLAELQAAAELVGRWVPPTPQYRWPLLDEKVGAHVWVKHENHTPVGAFKVRGGLLYVDRLLARTTADSPPPGIISATRGNHGQSLAFAGWERDVPVVIVVPHGNSPDKNASMRALGAEVVEFGHDFQASREHAAELATERGMELVPSFHPDLVLGVATYAYELFTAVPDLDTAYVPIGMGSGVCGLIGARDAMQLSTKIVGVVSERAPATALSFAAGEVRTTPTADTFVDGVACRTPDETAIGRMLRGAERIVTVSEDAAADATRILFAATHNAPEPSGALALAGALSERDAVADRRIAVIQTGGNVDAELFTTILSGATPAV